MGFFPCDMKDLMQDLTVVGSVAVTRTSEASAFGVSIPGIVGSHEAGIAGGSESEMKPQTNLRGYYR